MLSRIILAVVAVAVLVATLGHIERITHTSAIRYPLIRSGAFMGFSIYDQKYQVQFNNGQIDEEGNINCDGYTFIRDNLEHFRVALANLFYNTPAYIRRPDGSQAEVALTQIIQPTRTFPVRVVIECDRITEASRR